jgi:hypothetical protein
MKPRNREVNIFNMSVLDLLTGALGAFCFLTLALFPYYFKARNASAAGSRPADPNIRLAARNESLKAQIAAERAAGNQMPPFALLTIEAINKQNEGCATLLLKSAVPPPGAPAVAYRLINPQPGGQSFGLFLFVINTGPYHFVANATTTTPGDCTVSLGVVNTHQRQQNFVIKQSQNVQFDFNVERGDFAANLFD